MRRVVGACVAAAVALAGVLVAGPARAAVTTVELITVDPLNIDHWGTLTATLSGHEGCSQPVTYDWDLDGDGYYNDLTGTTSSTAEWRASQWSSGPGTYTVGVRADVCGETVHDQSAVTVPGAAGSFAVGLTPSAVTVIGVPVTLLVTIQNQPQPDDFSYAWDLDADGAFDDSNDPFGTFVPTALGTFQVRVRVLHNPSGSSATATSTIKVGAPTPVTLSPVTVTGTARVGHVLFSNGGVATPAGSTRSVRWLRDGVAISGATLATYRITTADAGRRIGVEVRATREGHGAATPVRSNAVPVAAHSSGRPTFSGTTRVGRRLTGTRGSWFAPGHTFSYRWLRDGRPITGATARTYVTKSADRGRRISLRVTARRAGFPVVDATSVARTISR